MHARAKRNLGARHPAGLTSQPGNFLPFPVASEVGEMRLESREGSTLTTQKDSPALVWDDPPVTLQTPSQAGTTGTCSLDFSQSHAIRDAVCTQNAKAWDGEVVSS